jgi:transcriptional regulator with XRE-family HTH domain
MNLRKQLKLYLARNGLSARQLARKSGVPNTTIGDWLAGRKPRNLDQVKRVADVLNTSIDHLVYGEGIQKPKSIDHVDDLIGDSWVSGIFEVRMRRVRNQN